MIVLGAGCSSFKRCIGIIGVIQGIMEKKMETTTGIVYHRGYTGVSSKGVNSHRLA